MASAVVARNSRRAGGNDEAEVDPIAAGEMLVAPAGCGLAVIAARLGRDGSERPEGRFQVAQQVARFSVVGGGIGFAGQLPGTQLDGPSSSRRSHQTCIRC